VEERAIERASDEWDRGAIWRRQMIARRPSFRISGRG